MWTVEDKGGSKGNTRNTKEEKIEIDRQIQNAFFKNNVSIAQHSLNF